jgi:putative lipoprotein
LPPGAVVKVQLVDVSRAGAPAVVLGEQLITGGGRQVPFAFEIPYDPAKIDQRFTYAVQARIENDGKLLFINDQRYAVITRGAPDHVDMVLRSVGGAPSN